MRTNTIFRLLLVAGLGLVFFSIYPPQVIYFYVYLYFNPDKSFSKHLQESSNASYLQEMFQLPTEADLGELILFQNRMDPNHATPTQTTRPTVELPSNPTTALTYQGLMLMKKKDFAQAKQIYQHIQDVYVQNGEQDSSLFLNVLYVLGDIHQQLGETPEAIDYYQQALGLEEKLFDADNPRYTAISQRLTELQEGGEQRCEALEQLEQYEQQETIELRRKVCF